MDPIDEIEYKYAYSVDKKDFTITWCISGVRMKNNDTEIGKISFRDITPVNYLVDIKNKSVKEKPLKAYMGSEDFFQFNEIK